MAHPGTYVNAPTLGVTGLVPGDSNTAVSFNPASNQYVVQDDTVPQQTFTSFTIGGILKPANANDSNAPNFWGIDGSVLELTIGQAGVSGKIDFAFSPGGGFSGSASFSGSTVMADGSTYRIIATWDGTTAKLYVNGSLDGSMGFSSADIIAGGGTAWVLDEDLNFYAATDQFDTTGNFSLDGVLDELFFVVNHAATAPEIAAIDAAMTGTGDVETEINALSPYIYWRLGESSGTTAEDAAQASGNIYTPPIAYDMGPINPDSEGLPRALFRHYSPHGRYLTVWKLATTPITYSLEQPWPLVSEDDEREGNLPIGNATEVTYLHCYQAPETVSDAEAARLIASGIGTVS